MMLLQLVFMIVFPGIYSIVQVVEYCRETSNNCVHVYGVPFPKISTFYTEISFILNIFIIISQFAVVGVIFYWNIFVHLKMQLYYKKASDTHSFLTGIDHTLVNEEQLLAELKDYNV